MKVLKEDKLKDLYEAYYQLDDILYDIDNQEELDTNNTILDLQLFKEKLEFYDLKSDELWDFIDLYMKLYNKE